MRNVRIWFGCTLVALGLTALQTCLSHADDGIPKPARRPISGPVVTGYEAPYPNWKSGHRGVDLLGQVGQPVVAAAAGVVTFAGQLAGRGVLVIDHGQVRTTYEPVTPTVAVGTHVQMSDLVATLDAGHDEPGCNPACLHWGLRRHDTYLNPLILDARPKVRLLALSSPWPTKSRPQLGTTQGLIRPAGIITSPFGWRIHPVLQQRIFHDGTDFGAGCGAPILAIQAGKVLRASDRGDGLGLSVEIDHGSISGKHVVSRYGHASAIVVSQGASVIAGGPIASVGSTGYSTGCHLHLSIEVDGKLVDPMSMLP